MPPDRDLRRLGAIYFSFIPSITDPRDLAVDFHSYLQPDGFFPFLFTTKGIYFEWLAQKAPGKLAHDRGVSLEFERAIAATLDGAASDSRCHRSMHFYFHFTTLFRVFLFFFRDERYIIFDSLRRVGFNLAVAKARAVLRPRR